jgi:hypothetical protein
MGDIEETITTTNGILGAHSQSLDDHSTLIKSAHERIDSLKALVTSMQDGEDEPAPDDPHEPEKLITFAGAAGTGLPTVNVLAKDSDTVHDALGGWGRELVKEGKLSVSPGAVDDFYWLDWIETSEEPDEEPEPDTQVGKLEEALTPDAFSVQRTRFKTTPGYIHPYHTEEFREARTEGGLFYRAEGNIVWGCDSREVLGGWHSTDNPESVGVLFRGAPEAALSDAAAIVPIHPDQHLYGRAAFLAREGFTGDGESYWLMNLLGSEFRDALSFELVSWYYFPKSYQFHSAGEKLSGFIMPETNAFLWTSIIGADMRLKLINQDRESDDFDSWREVESSNPIPLGRWFMHKQQVSFVERMTPSGMQNYAQVRVWVDDELVIDTQSHVREKGVTEFQLVPVYGGRDFDGSERKRADDFRGIGGAVLALYDHEL